MKVLPRNRATRGPSEDGIEGFEQALDKTYARLRERALAAWKRDHPGEDPADARVTVRIRPAPKAHPELASPKKRAPRALVAKRRKPRGKIPRTKVRRKA
jgi:hypothetical protein